MSNSRDFKYILKADDLRKSENEIIQNIVANDLLILPTIQQSLAIDISRDSIRIDINGTMIDSTLFNDSKTETSNKKLQDVTKRFAELAPDAKYSFADIDHAYNQRCISLYNCALNIAVEKTSNKEEKNRYCALPGEGQHSATFNLSNNQLTTTEENVTYRVSDSTKFSTPSRQTKINAIVETVFELTQVNAEKYAEIQRKKIAAIEQKLAAPSSLRVATAQQDRIARLKKDAESTSPKFLFKLIEIRTNSEVANHIFTKGRLPDFKADPFKNEVELGIEQTRLPLPPIIAVAPKPATPTPTPHRKKKSKKMLYLGLALILTGALLMIFFGVGTPAFLTGVVMFSCGAAGTIVCAGADECANKPIRRSPRADIPLDIPPARRRRIPAAFREPAKIVDPTKVPGGKDPRLMAAPKNPSVTPAPAVGNTLQPPTI